MQNCSESRKLSAINLAGGVGLVLLTFSCGRQVHGDACANQSENGASLESSGRALGGVFSKITLDNDNDALLSVRIFNKTHALIVLDKRALVAARFILIKSIKDGMLYSNLAPGLRPLQKGDLVELSPLSADYLLQFRMSEILPLPFSEIGPIELSCLYEPQVFKMHSPEALPPGYCHRKFSSNTITYP